MVTDAAMNKIALELGTAHINRLLVADTVRRQQATIRDLTELLNQKAAPTKPTPRKA